MDNKKIIKKYLVVIPARGGSKSVPKKNIKNFAGKPLIYHTFDSLKKIERNFDVVLSSDSLEILDLAKKYNFIHILKRPKTLAKDDSLSIHVIKHALSSMENKNNCLYENIIMLQPTSPLRTEQHITKSIEIYENENVDSLVSLVSVEGNHPFRMKRIVDNKVVNFIDQGFEDMRPRQVLPKVYIRNGAIYISKRELIDKNESFIGKNCASFIMSSIDSVNIDSNLDFEFAEFIYLKKKL
jgi:CMP-N,N'-diacetyllegionaminic acid synthase